METTAAPAARRGGDVRAPLDLVVLVLLAYVPFLLSSRGNVAADTKQYLYLDPGRLLSRAPYLFDPHVGFGTVPHQNIGYLFPMGPYYWLMDAVGVPDWVAQRIWLASISLTAALGARWLFRSLGIRRVAALAGALVYVLAPYQLGFTARISVVLLAWAALPWMVGLAMRAARDGGWRDPALFALVAMTAGSVNSSSLVLVLLGPVLWLVVHACTGRDAARAATGAAVRLGALTVAVSLWWIAGLRLQAAYGLPVLQLTETLRTVAAASDPVDVLRGIGNWFFYGRDRLGFSIQQAADYLHDEAVVVASFAIPVLALGAAVMVRWRHRAFFALLVVVGTVVGVGAWPYDDPSSYGALFKWFANETSAGLALRNTPRAAPLVVLGAAGLLAAAVGALRTGRQEAVAAAAVGALAVVALLPVWRVGYLSPGLERPEEVPRHWRVAAAALDRAGDGTRVLEIPGSSFAAYRWGNTVEPVTPGLVDRPFAAREVLPAGSPASVNLLGALDRRLQQGTFEPEALAPFARLTGVGTVVLRSDLAYERFDSPRPRVLWDALTRPLAPGLRSPRLFGPTAPNRAPRELPMVDALELRLPPGGVDPPAVALFDVTGAVPIVRTAPADRTVLLAGDGDGIVDAAAAGLIDGRQLVMQSAGLTRAQIDRALDAGADIVLTDSNRKRSEDFFAQLRDNTGYTEPAGARSGRDRDAFRLDPFPGSDDVSRTVVEQRGGAADATAYALSVDRPAYAFDGDPRTAWRVARRPVGARLVLRPDPPVRTGEVTLVQLSAQLEQRRITQVRLHFDSGDHLDVTLGPASLSPDGQLVTFRQRTIRELAVEIREVDRPHREALPKVVGFSEVRLGDARIRETVRLPVDVQRQTGSSMRGHRLDVVLSRLRYEPSQLPDEEPAMDRRVVLPDAREFALSGTARVNANAPDDVLDRVLGTAVPGTVFTASDHLTGDLDARASRAFDGDPSTRWSPALGPQLGRWIEVATGAETTVDRVDLTLVADGRHSVPVQLTLEVDGVPARTFTLPEPGDRARPDATRSVTVPFAPVTGSRFRLSIDAVREETTRILRGAPRVTLPVGIAEIGLAGVPRAPSAATLPDTCRDDLLRVNGEPVPLRVIGPASGARRGLPVASCAGNVDLRRGSNALVTGAGLDLGIDVDRLVLSSAADGAATPPTVVGAPLRDSGARARSVAWGATSHDVTVRTDGRPFWLVVGQSATGGWEAKADGRSLGDPVLVNGFANGWLVRPDGPGTIAIALRWTPQRVVWWGIGLSILAITGCVALAVAGRRREARPSLVSPPRLGSPFRYGDGGPAARVPWSAGATATLALTAGLGAALVSRWWIGALVAVATAVAARVSGGRIALAGGSPLALALGKALDLPELGWVAVAFLAADLAVGALAGLRARAPAHPVEAGEPLDDLVGQRDDLAEQ